MPLPFSSWSWPGSRADAVRALIAAPRWNREQLVAYQSRRLRSIVRHAARNVPFYQALYADAGLDPESIRGVEDLATLPVIDKPHVQRDPAAFLQRGVNPDTLVWHLTSGSSGQPMRICRRRVEEHLLQAFRFRAWLLLGMRLTDLRASVIAHRSMRNETVIPDRNFVSRFGVLRRAVIDIDEPPREIIRRLQELNAEVVSGYPEGLLRVALEMNDADREGIRPRFVVTGAEELRPDARAYIEMAFQARAYSFYGAHECNLVAWECGVERGFHICEDNVIVELLRDGKPVQPGEEGEVTITTLHSYTMPFLRYRLGDLAIHGGQCACGLPFATLAALQGRTSDAACRADGTTVPTVVFCRVFAARHGWIRHYQAVQTEPGKLHVSIVPARQPTDVELTEIVDDMRARHDLALSCALVDEVPIRPAGKMPRFISLERHRSMQQAD